MSVMAGYRPNDAAKHIMEGTRSKVREGEREKEKQKEREEKSEAGDVHLPREPIIRYAGRSATCRHYLSTASSI